MPEAKAQLILNEEFSEASVRRLETFSHIWLQFVFHQTQQQDWKEMVRPPRLGGNSRIGVFATRSPFRPNAIGLSVVELLSVNIKDKMMVLGLGGCDCVDGTPVLDIKPYIPYADAIPDAQASFAAKKPKKWGGVFFTQKSQQDCERASSRLKHDIKPLIESVLSYDPRPAYHRDSYNQDRVYSMKLHDFDLQWQYCENNTIKVIAISGLNDCEKNRNAAKKR